MPMFQEDRKMEAKLGRNRGEIGEKWDMVGQLVHSSRSHFPPFSYRSPISQHGR